MHGSAPALLPQSTVDKSNLISFDSNVWASRFFRKFTHTSELIFLERLLNFSPAVHHEWTVTDDRFVKWFTVHHQRRGLGGTGIPAQSALLVRHGPDSYYFTCSVSLLSVLPRCPRRACPESGPSSVPWR